jgi:hypothetical protein
MQYNDTQIILLLKAQNVIVSVAGLSSSRFIHSFLFQMFNTRGRPDGRCNVKLSRWGKKLIQKTILVIQQPRN